MDVIVAEFRIKFAELQCKLDNQEIGLTEYVTELTEIVYAYGYKKGWRDAVQAIMENSIL